MKENGRGWRFGVKEDSYCLNRQFIISDLYVNDITLPFCESIREEEKKEGYFMQNYAITQW
jgi:hypothetical protein